MNVEDWKWFEEIKILSAKEYVKGNIAINLDGIDVIKMHEDNKWLIARLEEEAREVERLQEVLESQPYKIVMELRDITENCLRIQIEAAEDREVALVACLRELRDALNIQGFWGDTMEVRTKRDEALLHATALLAAAEGRAAQETGR